MCVLFIAVQARPGLPILIAANRDEDYSRPSSVADYWPESPHVLAGRDLEGGGTWAGVTRSGRFAALTNFREPSRVVANAPSRGALVAGFLKGHEPPEKFLNRIALECDRYNGFNLIVGDSSGAYSFGSRDPARRVVMLAPGVHGLSNGLLDEPWPKVRNGKRAFERILLETAEEPAGESASDSRDGALEARLLSLLRDETSARDFELPRTGVPLQIERLLSPIFIRSERYGAVSSTILRIGERVLDFSEWTYRAGVPESDRHFSIVMSGGLSTI